MIAPLSGYGNLVLARKWPELSPPSSGQAMKIVKNAVVRHSDRGAAARR